LNILILIPCFNTHIYIKDLINQLRYITDCDILIYDDGSSPSLKFNSEYENIIFLRNDINKGKGYSLYRGLNYAVKNGYNHVITMDGDMQHSPSDIDKFINLSSKIDFAFGSRKLSSPMPLHRVISNKLTSLIISLFINRKINDSQCGFRRYKLSSLNLNNINNYGYLYETEIIFNSLSSEKSIKNIEIETIYQNSPSNINNFKDTFRFINLIFKYIFA